jgi:hypothetical protein
MARRTAQQRLFDLTDQHIGSMTEIAFQMDPAIFGSQVSPIVVRSFVKEVKLLKKWLDDVVEACPRPAREARK